jgi:hypothetical protein
MDHNRVSFRWKDYADNHRTKVMTVSAEEFVDRTLGTGWREVDGDHLPPNSPVRCR